DALVGDIASDTIVSRTIFNQPTVRMIVFGFAPGQELSEHTSSKTAILHFLRGTARLTLGGKPQSATSGTLVHMAPNLPHSVFAESETVMLLTMIG
ncbi:MAG: cupin domain-containing protein, partial [Caldilineaceae bacterium]